MTPAPREQATLPGFQPYTHGVPSWLLSMFDQSGASSAQRGRKGAPWEMRTWIYAVLSVDVRDRTGKAVTLPTTLGDIEKWIWPDGWDRSNRRKHWAAFRERLIRLGTIRPVITDRDGREFLIEVVRAPVVPREWSPAAPCPLVVSIPAKAAAGAAVNWPALLHYGADSPGMFRAYLATVAVLDYSARRGQSITRDIPAVVLAEDGKPKRRRGGKLKRDPARRVENPAARFVGSLTDENLRQMLGLPNERINRTRARRCMERLHEDNVIDLVRGRRRPRANLRAGASRGRRPMTAAERRAEREARWSGSTPPENPFDRRREGRAGRRSLGGLPRSRAGGFYVPLTWFLCSADVVSMFRSPRAGRLLATV